MTELVPASRGDLDALAAGIRRELEAAEADFQSAVAHAIEAGELLIEAKAQLPHGAWLSWLDANCPLGEREARRYMQLARNRSRVADLPSIREAVAALSASREDTEPRDLPSTGQATAFTASAAGWLTEAIEAALEADPPPPEPPLPENTEDHLEMARFWIEVAERANHVIRRVARRAALIAAHGNGAEASAYARLAAAGLQLADTEPFDEDYERLSAEYNDALSGLDPLPETADEVSAILAAMAARIVAQGEKVPMP